MMCTLDKAQLAYYLLLHFLFKYYLQSSKLMQLVMIISHKLLFAVAPDQLCKVMKEKAYDNFSVIM